MQRENHQLGQRYKSFCSILAFAICYNLSSIFFGYSMAYFSSISFSNIQKIFNLNSKGGVSQGIYSGCIPFGAIFGCLLSQKIIVWFSRKHSIYVVNAIAIFSTILIVFKNPTTLLIGRIIQGACTGMYSSIVPLVVKQYSPVMLSGPLGALQNNFIAIGFLFGYLISYVFSFALEPYQYYIYSYSFPIIIIFPQQVLLMTVFTSETPKYLLAMGRNEEAKELINEIYLQEYQEIVYHQKLKDLEADNEEFQNQEKEYPKDNPKAVFFAISLQLFQQLTGINVLIIYGNQLALSFLPQLEHTFPLMINSEKIIVSFLTVLLLGKLGRRIILLVGQFFLIIPLFGIFLGFLYHQNQQNHFWTIPLLLSSFFIYILSFVMTFGPIPWLYIPEIVQPNIVPFATVTNWSFCSLIIGLFPVIRAHSENKGCPGLYLFFCICTLIYFFITYKFMVESRGKTELEIREQFNEISIC